MAPKKVTINANRIDAAAREILGVLEDTSKENVIYFHGWDGLGASAALKLVARCLKSSNSKFDKVVHVDCSMWKSMRALQKAIAEEVELPQSVMAIFDRHDEEDDFNGVDEGSRGVIPDVTGEIFRKLANSRHLVILHNGCEHYIDLDECGVTITRFLSNIVLWTWQGRFGLRAKVEDGEIEKMSTQTGVFIQASITGITDEAFWDILCEEAKEVVTYAGIPEPDIYHMIVVGCFLYAWALRCNDGIDWGTHASNYWVCDGIIEGQGYKSAWEVGDALQRNMRLHWLLETIRIQEKIDAAILHCLRWRPKNHWVSATHQALLQDDTSVLPAEVTSFFLLADKPDSTMILPTNMFQHSESNRLRVLHLSRCTFSFASPPFLYCSQLRFLMLDHCTNITDKEHPSQNRKKSCFQKLWVLHLRYTNWYWLVSEEMISLMDDLRELNVEGMEHWSISDLCGNGPSLVKLRVTADSVRAEDKDTNNQAQFPNMSDANSLKTIILHGCVGLEQVIHDVLPPSIESFSFINRAGAIAKISSISFRGCTKLKNILLRGLLGSLQDLDLSCTAVKVLDLREVEAPNLKRLILLGCEKLCAILWPPQATMIPVLEVLRIDTTQSGSFGQANWEEKTKEASTATATGSSSIVVCSATKQGNDPFASFDFAWHISVRDARLLRSLLLVIKRFVEKIYLVTSVYVEIDSSPASRVVVGDSEVAQGIKSLQQPDHYLYTRDVVFQGHLQAVIPNEGMISWMWACPPPRRHVWFTTWSRDIYAHVQDEQEMKSGLLQQHRSIEGTSTSAALPPAWIYDFARVLHVHDISSITCISGSEGSKWRALDWCRVERCPKLLSVFPTTQGTDYSDSFSLLTTFWASQLPIACYIWNWTIQAPSSSSFEELAFVHLDYCPRLIHVLPLSGQVTLDCLETLEIVCCGNLREVFPLDPERQNQQKIIKFPKLRCIHLHELPMLQYICGYMMSAPLLETVKIRGCWSLRRLLAVGGNAKPPKVDCEKEWWDNLIWDGLEANHHPQLYQLSHSPYYKAQLPRGTVLR